jgi:trehalose-6-phosphate synthase
LCTCRYALTTNPFDVQETADAILASVDMPKEERRRRARGISRSVLAHTPETWLWNQLEGMDEVRQRGAEPSKQSQEGRHPRRAFDDQIGGGY